MAPFTHTLVALLLLGAVAGEGDLGYDCRRKDCECQNGGTCDIVLGQCVCATGFQGFDCSVATADVAPACTPGEDGSPQCYNDATCKTDLTCGCDGDTYGAKCQNYRVHVWCTETEMFVNVNPYPAAFEGDLYVEGFQGVAGCDLEANDITTATLPDYVLDFNNVAPTGLSGYYIQLSHTAAEGTEAVCGNAEIVELNQDNADGTTTLLGKDYYRQLKLVYNPIVDNALDQLVNLKCSVNNTDNIESFSSFNAVNVDIADDGFTQVNVSDIFEPIRFEVLDTDGRAITNAISLGDPINLKFTLLSADFTKIRINQCEANTGVPGGSEIIFFEDNCPANWPALFRGYMEESAETKSATLQLKAFRFRGDIDTVVFVCTCKLCKAENEAECARNPACEPNENAGDGADGGTTPAPGDGGGTTPAPGAGEGGTTAAPAEAGAGGTTAAPPVDGATTAAPAAGAGTTAALAEAEAAINFAVRRKRSSDDEEAELTQKITVKTSSGVEKDVRSMDDADCMLQSEVVIIIVTFTVALVLLLVLVVVLVIRTLRTRHKVVGVPDDAASAVTHNHYTLPRLSVANF